MATNLNLDDELLALTSKTNADTGWHTALRTMLDAALLSTGNAFGTAALRDTGLSANQIPILGDGGKLDASLIPNLDAADVAGTFTESQIDKGSIPPAKFTSGFFPYQTVPGFDANKIQGRIASARLPASPNTPISSLVVKTEVTATNVYGGIPGQTSTGPHHIVRYSSADVEVSFSGNTLTITFKMSIDSVENDPAGGPND